MSRRRAALLLLVALAALVTSIAAGGSVVSKPTRAAPPPAPPPPIRFYDVANGYSIAYPAAWTRLRADDPQVRLLAADGRRVSLLIRVAPVGLTVTPRTLGIARDLTDALVGADRHVRQLAAPEPVTLDGVPGLRYRYRSTGGAHLHYFLFWHKRLITLVFQVPDARALARDSGLLDRVAGTFRAV